MPFFDGATLMFIGHLSGNHVYRHAHMDELLEGMSATEFMLRFTITNPDMHTTIVGTLSPAHLHENVAAVLQGPLPASVYNEAKRRLAPGPCTLS